MSDEFFTREDATLVQNDKLFPVGVYDITIVGCTVNNKDGKKWISLEVIVTSGEHEGRKKWLNLYTNQGHPNEKLWKWHLGILSSLDKAIAVEKMTADHVIGQSCRMEITHSTRDGNTYDNVKKFLPSA